MPSGVSCFITFPVIHVFDGNTHRRLQLRAGSQSPSRSRYALIQIHIAHQSDENWVGTRYQNRCIAEHMKTERRDDDTLRYKASENNYFPIHHWGSWEKKKKKKKGRLISLSGIKTRSDYHLERHFPRTDCLIHTSHS